MNDRPQQTAADIQIITAALAELEQNASVINRLSQEVMEAYSRLVIGKHPEATDIMTAFRPYFQAAMTNVLHRQQKQRRIGERKTQRKDSGIDTGISAAQATASGRNAHRPPLQSAAKTPLRSRASSKQKAAGNSHGPKRVATKRPEKALPEGGDDEETTVNDFPHPLSRHIQRLGHPYAALSKKNGAHLDAFSATMRKLPPAKRTLTNILPLFRKLASQLSSEADAQDVLFAVGTVCYANDILSEQDIRILNEHIIDYIADARS